MAWTGMTLVFYLYA